MKGVCAVQMAKECVYIYMYTYIYTYIFTRARTHTHTHYVYRRTREREGSVRSADGKGSAHCGGDRCVVN